LFFFFLAAGIAPAGAQAPEAPVARPSGSDSAPVAAAVGRGQIVGAAQVRRNVPVVGAVVTAVRAGVGGLVRVTTTDARGAFKFEGLEDGRYRCEIARGGFVAVVKDDVELRAPFRAVVEVTMARAAAGAVPPPAPAVAQAGGAAVALRGVVRDRVGKGSGEIRVTLTREDGAEDPREAVTTAEGAFGFEGLTPARWHVELQGAGLLPLRTTLGISEDVSLQAVLVPQPADYAPQVEDLLPREEPVPPR
jgi:hypothetical protein